MVNSSCDVDSGRGQVTQWSEPGADHLSEEQWRAHRASVRSSHHRAKGKLSQQSVTPTRQANKEQITDQSVNSRCQWWMQA